MSIESKFSNEVSVKRKIKGLTQEQLAEKMEVSPRWIQCVERGNILPGAHLMVRLSQFLDIDIRRLF